MSLSPSAPTSPLPRQLLRYVSSQLAAAFQRPAPTISLPSSALRGVDAAVSQQLRTAASRAAPSPKGRPGAPRQGSGGHVHAAPATATTARVVMRGPAPPGPPAEGSGGKVHVVSPAATATASVLMRGPVPPGSPAEGAGGRGGSIHAANS